MHRSVLALGLVFTAIAEAGADSDFFQQKIRPIFSSHCQGCHNDTLKFSGLTPGFRR